ncbi:hypothetical protein AVEN_231600-1, partial [Araneus ventricosus]
MAISQKKCILFTQRDAIPSVFPVASDTNKKNLTESLRLDFAQKRCPVPIVGGLLEGFNVLKKH